MDNHANCPPHQKNALLPAMILFELLYKLFVWAVVQPLFRLILNAALSASGNPLAFNNDIMRFLFTVPGIIAAVILIVLSSLITYIEFAALITLAGYGQQNRRPVLPFIIREIISSLRNLLHPSTLAFCLYVLGMLPFISIGFASSLLPGFSLPNFILRAVLQFPGGNYLWDGVTVLLFVLFLLSLFTMPVMVLQKCSFGKALARGFQFTRHYGWRLLGVYGGFLALWVLMAGLPQLLFSFVFGSVNVSLSRIVSVFGYSLEGFLLMALLFCSWIVKLVMLPVLMHYVVARYAAAGGDINLPVPTTEQQRKPLASKAQSDRKNVKLSRSAKWGIVGVAAAVIVMFGYSMLHLFFNAPGIHPPIVVGHRGSVQGVENTLESIQGAIDAGADYAEIDILLSADGVPMVIHDANLRRLTGENVNVYDLTADELQQLTLKQNNHTGRIPTLDEVVRFCQGRIGLVVEFKLHAHEQADVVERTMTILQQYSFVESCIFMSMDFSLVADIIDRYPQAITGYCVYGSVGSLNVESLSDLEIDFIVIEESMVSRANLYDYRTAWLPVYVWTVNNKDNMRQYLELGVSGIITDYPDIGMQVLEEYEHSNDLFYMNESVWTQRTEAEG